MSAARLQSDGGSRTFADSRVQLALTVGANLALATFYSFFLAAHFAAARVTGRWLAMAPIMVLELLLATMFLLRRQSLGTSSQLLDWIVGVGGTLLPLLLRPTAPMGSLSWLGVPLQAVGSSLGALGLLFLGRSVAVIAAARAVKTAGPYQLVRHPMYAAYMLTYLGYVLTYPTPRNCICGGATVVALIARAIVEERFLQREQAYREYLQRVRWRFVPYVH